MEFDYFENLLASFSSQGVVIIRVFRLLRISRLFKLFRSKHFARLNMILNIIYISIPSLMNVISLMFLMYIIFSVVAVFMFKDAKLPDGAQNEVYNFDTFHSSLLTLFRASTGEDWPLLMYHYGEAEGLYVGSRVFFIVFVLILTYIMINMIQLIVVQIFDELYFDPLNPLNQFKESLDEFNKVWNIFSAPQKGNAISASSVVSFFAHLQYVKSNKGADGLPCAKGGRQPRPYRQHRRGRENLPNTPAAAVHRRSGRRLGNANVFPLLLAPAKDWCPTAASCSSH